MPNEQEPQPAQAAAQAEAAKKAEADRKTKADITKALTDQTTVRQLSSTGDAARARRGYYLNREDEATPKSESALPGFEHPSNVSVTLPLLYGKMTLAEALDEEDNVLFPLAYSSQREDFFFGSTSIAKTSRLSYHSISPLRKAKHADLEISRSGNTAASMFVYRYTLIIGGSIQGNGCYFGYRCPTKLESQHVPAIQTRNSAPKPLPSSGFKKTAQMSQYRSYGDLDFQVVRV
ncbi:hypothetical protein GMDG_07987 [Pseudogymnoascus destructans 20631-21]|uniref:Uncharacterized protein n=1 Tax=Pseudogymnoascus destructans (strain ATCC MYA-4855 / 20631-21) TaxID=658429 RepID=L8G004_PSED2|nr:hypothetical protein GMDG_07987 [Pseudogymnoascus destructans 20631-21]